MNRGRRHETVFSDKQDFTGFINLLQETVEMFNLRVSAFCLMPNHYHLLVQTPDANVSRCMRHIDGVYTQRYNRRHRYDGQLFRGRYKSILVDEKSYLLELVRYIHHNPVKAGLAETLGQYPWSSHKGYISKVKKWNWLHKGYVLRKFSRIKNEQLKRYRTFVARESGSELDSIIEGKKWPSILGSEKFIRRIKETFFSDKVDDEVPESQSLAPEVEDIILMVCSYYKISLDELLSSQRGVFNEPRNVAIYLTRRLRQDTLKQICEPFRIHTYKTVSSILCKMNGLLKHDKKLKKKIDRLITKAKSHQEI
jgi:REP element-mobilizing transposase RayT